MITVWIQRKDFRYFTGAVLLAFTFGMVWHALPLQPRALHISAQCDRASFAQNYYYDGIDLLHPRINNLMKGTGIAAAEFPLLGAVTALLYHTFGYHDFWYRLLVLLLFTWGCKHAFTLAKEWLSPEKAAAVLLLWMSSPVLMYYAPNFNPDPAALAFTLLCWLLFYTTNRYRSITLYMLFTLAASLALLLKASTAISFVAMGGLIAADYLKWLSPHKQRILAYKPAILAAMLTAAIVSYLWYSYAAQLNESVYSGFFTLSSRIPDNTEQFITITKNFSKFMLLRYYHPIMLILIMLLQMAIVIWNKHVPRLLVLTSLALCAGTFSFMLLMYVALEYHDYYIIAMMPWPLFVMIAAAILLERLPNKRLQRKLKYGSVALIAGSLVYCRQANAAVYRDLNDPFYEAYYDIEPQLRKAGIQRNDLVVSIADFSYDVSLYLMNQKGYTVFERKDLPRVWYYLNRMNGKYLITNTDDCLPESPLIQSYVGKPIITHKNISVYKPSKNLHVNSIVSERIQLFRTKFLNDEKMMILQQNVSKATGISIDALIDDVCIYLYKVTDEELQPKFKTYCAQHNDKDTTLLIENFILENKLNEEQSYVIRHPYRLWFN
jgi:hypothetical protein